MADALTPIEGFNDIRAVLSWNISVIEDPFSEFPLSGETVRISRTVQVKGLKEVDARLVDGKNFMAEDFLTEISFNKVKKGYIKGEKFDDSIKSVIQ